MSGGGVVLVGFMGAGKSTAARSARGGCGARALDADQIIERQSGKTIAEIFDGDGEPAFRALEEHSSASCSMPRARIR